LRSLTHEERQEKETGRARLKRGGVKEVLSELERVFGNKESE